ncbi:hypothetical protein OGAPHI_006000 [Ogataea philodendri]|uniref:Autophagy-related protein 21 n=1 Tax=Ogataea philodendri TaxID=1378263 RepID=A0A9P8NYI8_9ASCO|nr:uncharacterized protein OGAPHI_006000 [Ogataea philodendri]KAH3661822.1 hypothetical protein OGAPHI_006000 [Ogataea philodendri]
MSVQCLSFNQDYSCLAVGFDTAYKVYNCEPFGECFDKTDDGGAKLAEMLFSTSLIAVVGLGERPSTTMRKLKIINTKRKAVICELSFPTPILFVKMNRKRLIVVLVDQLFIYDVSCMKLLHTIETGAEVSERVICDLSSSDDSVLVFQSGSSQEQPGPDQSSVQTGTLGTTMGTVVLFDALNIQPLNVIQCHKSPLQRIAISKDGKLLATASVKGTIIRVFRVADGKKVHEFRRGSYSAHVSCLSFNVDSTMLCCSSNTGTVHFFRLEPLGTKSSADSISTESDNPESLPEEHSITEEESNEINRLINTQLGVRTASGRKKSAESLKNFIWSKSKTYLPSQINSILEPKRDFAFLKLNVEVESVVGLVDGNCYVATKSGDFLVYSVQPGECVLLKHYKIE